MKENGLQRVAVCLGLYLSFFSALVGAQQVSVTPSSVDFGNVSLGTSKSQGVTITNVSSSKIGVSQASVTGTGYAISGIALPIVLSPGQSVSFNVTFAPPSVGTDSGYLSLVTQVWNGNRKLRVAASTSVLSLSGSGVGSGQLAASPASVAFGTVMVGGSQTLSPTVTNTGTASTTISQVALSSAAYGVTGLIPPVSLAVGQSLTFNITFAPVASGSSSASLVISSDAANSPLTIALSGTGASPGQLQLTPATYNFGSITAGTSGVMSGTLAASGAAVTISSASSTNAEFALSGLAFPVTLASGQSIPFSVTFLPQSSGTASASLSFLSNATNSPVTETLAGTGTTPAQHSVGLSWNASSASGILGYNVYRSGVTGGPYAAVTTSPDPSLTFSDTTVAAGQTYYYVVTALDSTGAESAYSNEAQAVVPSP